MCVSVCLSLCTCLQRPERGIRSMSLLMWVLETQPRFTARAEVLLTTKPSLLATSEKKMLTYPFPFVIVFSEVMTSTLLGFLLSTNNEKGDWEGCCRGHCTDSWNGSPGTVPTTRCLGAPQDFIVFDSGIQRSWELGTEKQILAHEWLGSDFQDSPSSDVPSNIHSLDWNSPERLPPGRFGVFLCSCLKGMFTLVAPMASALTMLPHSPSLKNLCRLSCSLGVPASAKLEAITGRNPQILHKMLLQIWFYWTVY